MQVTLQQIMPVVDAVLTIADFAAHLTQTTADDEAIAKIREYREKLRPVVGASGEGVEAFEPVEAHVPLMAAGQDVAALPWSTILQVLLQVLPLFIKK